MPLLAIQNDYYTGSPFTVIISYCSSGIPVKTKNDVDAATLIPIVQKPLREVLTALRMSSNIELTAHKKAMEAAVEDPLPEQMLNDNSNSCCIKKAQKESNWKWQKLWPWLLLSTVLLLQTLDI